MSHDDDWIGWSGFFLNADEEQANASLARARSILALYDDLKEWWLTRPRPVRRSRSRLDLWEANFPIIRLCAEVGDSLTPASRILRILRDSDLLAVVSDARGRQPAILAFSRLLRWRKAVRRLRHAD